MWSGSRDAELIREYGHDLIDRVAAYLEGVSSLPVSPNRSDLTLEIDLSEPLPQTGRSGADVWGELWDLIAKESIHLRHPMYMGHQVAPPLLHAALAELVIGLLNQSVAVWEMSPTGTLVESQLIRWMIELLGYPPESDGTFVSGGSVANLTGLLAARAAVFPDLWEKGVAGAAGASRAIIFASAQSHYSMERAIGVLGLGSSALCPVPERSRGMDPGALAESIREAKAAGRVPLAIVATAGSTPTGHFDDLNAIAEIAEREGVWLHIDGAHGASFVISDRLRDRVRGIERADSVSWDPHKMMFMPISLGAIFVRDRRWLDTAFQQSAPYLFHSQPDESRSPDTGRRTLQCSRRFDALKLWITLRHHGIGHFAELLERTVTNTQTLYEKLNAADDFEPMHRPESNILCFRYLPDWLDDIEAQEVDSLQTELRERYNESGRGWITTTLLEGRRVLRVTLMNPATETADLDRLLDGLRWAAAGLRQGPKLASTSRSQ